MLDIRRVDSGFFIGVTTVTSLSGRYVKTANFSRGILFLQIDRTTIQAAKDVFERLYGNLEGLGLSREATKALIRYNKVPRWVLKTDMQLANELTAIASEFRKILVRVMKVYRTL